MQQWYKCSKCGKDILHGTNPCPYCKCSLAWSQQGPVLYIPPPMVPQQAAQPPSGAPQQVPTSKLGGGIICANCGSIVIPVKSKFGCGWFALWFILGVIPGIIYAIYYAGKRADICPVCEKNAYIKKTES